MNQKNVHEFYLHSLDKFILEEKIINENYLIKINYDLFFYFLNLSETVDKIYSILNLQTKNQKKYLFYLHQSQYFKDSLYNLSFQIKNINSIEEGRNQFINQIINIYSSPRVQSNLIYHQDYFLNYPIIKKCIILLDFLQEHYKKILLTTIIILIIKFIFEQFRL
jgi:hypothetical protein